MLGVSCEVGIEVSEREILTRYTKQNAAEHCGGCTPVAYECQGLVPAKACVGHRCDEHAAVPIVNDVGPDKSECAICVAQAFVKGYEKAFEKTVFWPAVQSARDRLNLLAPGAGAAFVDETRATLNAAGIETEW